jgi:hypothetical protein
MNYPRDLWLTRFLEVELGDRLPPQALSLLSVRQPYWTIGLVQSRSPIMWPPPSKSADCPYRLSFQYHISRFPTIRSSSPVRSKVWLMWYAVAYTEVSKIRSALMGGNGDGWRVEIINVVQCCAIPIWNEIPAFPFLFSIPVLALAPLCPIFNHMCSHLQYTLIEWISGTLMSL